MYQALGVVGIYTTPWTDTAGVDAVMFIATQTTTCEAEKGLIAMLSKTDLKNLRHWF